MPGLPPIDLGQLKSLLMDPSMPSHNILMEVAHTIDSSGRSDGESEAEDHPVPSLFDMIIDASMKVDVEDTDDEEEESCHVPHGRRISCQTCGKVFSSSWPLNMHMAVAHRSGDVEIEKSGKSRLGKRSRMSRDAESREKKIRLSSKSGRESVGEGSRLLSMMSTPQVDDSHINISVVCSSEKILSSNPTSPCDQRLNLSESNSPKTNNLASSLDSEAQNNSLSSADSKPACSVPSLTSDNYCSTASTASKNKDENKAA